jgi:hypothetical protein
MLTSSDVVGGYSDCIRDLASRGPFAVQTNNDTGLRVAASSRTVLLQSREQQRRVAATKVLVNHCPGAGETDDCPILGAFVAYPKRMAAAA